MPARNENPRGAAGSGYKRLLDIVDGKKNPT
jgi:hypothetical protein